MRMNNEDEFLSFSVFGVPSSSTPDRKLRCSEKSSGTGAEDVVVNRIMDDKRLVGDESLLMEESNGGSGVLRVEEGVSRAKRSLKFESMTNDLAEMGGEEQSGRVEQDDDPDNFVIKELDKKRQKVKKKNEGSSSNKRKEAKERNDRMMELRKESQRLLRETRDASFRPAPLAQKSVSSLLEKIRQRKLEISKKSAAGDVATLVVVDDGDHDVDAVEFNNDNSLFKNVMDTEAVEFGQEMTVSPVESDKNVPRQDILDDAEFHSQRTTTPEDFSNDSQSSDWKDGLLDEADNSPMEEVMEPSSLAMDLKLDHNTPVNFSSDEEDNDKENIDPSLIGLADSSSFPKGDPVKAFFDEEAEEEDDSDNDARLFQDTEEDEDDTGSEGLNDMIAAEYDEKPIDKDKRDQLHQRWLEQQDAAGTENLLLRLKCGSALQETAMVDEMENEFEEDEAEPVEEAIDYSISRNMVRMNLKKAKQMIPLMFTDKDDAYVSSEEEAEAVATENIFCKADDSTSILSPVEDKDSKGIFGLIKQLNGVPESRKKAKIASYLHSLSLGGNTTTMTQPSFLSKRTSKTLPSYHKPAPRTGRSFIFARDESYSRSTFSSISEDSSDVIQVEDRQKKTASFAKLKHAPAQSSSVSLQNAASTSSAPLLHDILRYPLKHLEQRQGNGTGLLSHAEAIYAAFKLDQNHAKRPPHQLPV